MGQISSHALVATFLISALGALAYLSYTVVNNLYRDFMHFSRRFRGVE